MKQLIVRQLRPFQLLITGLLFTFCFLLFAPQANALGLKLAPLMFEETLADGEKKKGFVDISNPSDQQITVTADVQGFRQINSDGDLEFFSEESYRQGIKFDYDEFTLNSREALRLYFLLDANQLPRGGVYATMLFTTASRGGNPDNTSIQPATRVGAHLIIQNGGGGTKNAFIKELKVPLFQFGSSVKAAASVSNVGGEKSLAFFPEVSVATAPFGKSARLKAPLVMPGNSRNLQFELPANHFGFVRLSAETSGKKVYAWTFAATGNGRWLGPLAILFLIVLVYFGRRYRRLVNANQAPAKSRKK